MGNGVGPSPQDERQQSGDPQPSGGDGLGVQLMTLDDPDQAFSRVREQYAAGNAPMPILDPSVYDTEPATVSTDQTQRLIQESADRRVEALREVEEQRQQQARQARNRALLNLAGPTAFQTVTGANIDSGLDQRLRQQREAERRARELEQQARRESARLQTEADIRAQQLETETQRRNQEARQAAEQRQLEALGTFAGQARDLSESVIEARQEAAEGGGTSGGGGGGASGLDIGDAQDALELVRETPSMGVGTIQQISRASGLPMSELLAAQSEAQRGEATAQDPAQVATELMQANERRSALATKQQERGLITEEQRELQTLRERRPQLRQNLQTALNAELNDLARDAQQGRVADLSRFNQGIEALNLAQAAGLRTVNFGGQRRDIGAVRDALVMDMQELQGRRPEPEEGQERSDSFFSEQTLQRVGLRLDQGNTQESGQGAAGQAQPTDPEPEQDTETEPQGGRASQRGSPNAPAAANQSGASRAPAPEGQEVPRQDTTDADVTVGDLVDIHGRQGLFTGIQSATRAWLDERGISPEQFPITVQTPSGDVQTISSVDDLANVALNTGRAAAQDRLQEELTDFRVSFDTGGGS